MSSYLPVEIILNILSRLQVKTLLRFRCVCRSWSNLLTSNNLDFVKMHLHHAVDEKNNNCSLIINHSGCFYSIDSVSSSSSEFCYQAVQINTLFKSRLVLGNSSSCNGLFCSTTDRRGNFVIWNPSTKEYKEISAPQPNTSTYDDHRVMAYGFGYDNKLDDYKLVRIEKRSWRNDYTLPVYVCTLGSNSWRNVQSVPPFSFEAKETTGVLLKEALHWIDYDIGSKIIVSFEIGDERFQEIELPNCLFGKSTSNVCALRGDLCVHGHMGKSSDLWMMKDYGVVESWTKLFSIALDRSFVYLKPICSFKNGDILFWVRLKKKKHVTSGLVSYDPNHERGSMLNIQGIPKWFVDIETYVGSLVSPNRVLL